MRLVSVAVPVPAVDALTYRVPDPIPMPVPGARVLVPLGTRVLTGVVLARPTPRPRMRSPGTSSTCSTTTRCCRPDVLTLVRWVADYYACGAGEALSAAMPPRTWIESERHAQITAAGRERLFLEKGLRAEILAKLADGKPARVDTLTTRSGHLRRAHGPRARRPGGRDASTQGSGLGVPHRAGRDADPV